MSRGPGWFASLGLLAIRVGFGGILAYGHGWPKYNDPDMFKQMQGLTDPMQLVVAPYAGYLLIGAELACAALVAIGLFTRLASIPVAYAMGVAAFVAHQAHPLVAGATPGPSKELALLYMIAFAALFFTGPGKFSLDNLFFGRSYSERTLEA